MLPPSSCLSSSYTPVPDPAGSPLLLSMHGIFLLLKPPASLTELLTDPSAYFLCSLQIIFHTAGRMTILKCESNPAFFFLNPFTNFPMHLESNPNSFLCLQDST